MKYIQNDPPQVRNNVKLAEVEPGRCRYLFVDSTEHHADRIIVGALIPAKFEPLDPDDTRRRDFEQPQGSLGFEQRICSFDSRYESWFLCCMADLEWVLQNEGSYFQACEQLLGAPAVIRCARAQLPQPQGQKDETPTARVALQATLLAATAVVTPPSQAPAAGLKRLALQPVE